MFRGRCEIQTVTSFRGVTCNRKLRGIFLVVVLHQTLFGRINNFRLVEATIPCKTTADCESIINRPGVVCMQNVGICSNPYQSGCLVNRLPGWTKKRVCNSDDPSNATNLGICLPPDLGLNYMEIRIASQNWESAFFEAWLMQIVLSEILDIPTTIETGTSDAKVNLYDSNSRFDYGRGYAWDSLEVAGRVGDCRKVKQRISSSTNNYSACAHVMPEVWGGQTDNINRLTTSGVIEPVSYMGLVGQNGWFIPLFTAKRDPSLLSHWGLMGESNRQKLADRFLRPTSWGDYCSTVSTNNCTTPDSVAEQGPITTTDKNRYFVKGLYTGYFQKTDDNNCTLRPENCSGHFADYPCGWTSYLVPVTHYLDIALQSSGPGPVARGYSYSQLTEIWHAANWTKSDVIMAWWNPEALYHAFLGTEAEFQLVSLPSPTHKCLAARIQGSVRCKGTIEERVGTATGVCGDPPFNAMKAISSRLFQDAFNSARRSPAYEALKNFQINEFQLGKIFEYWKSSVDLYGFGARDATCRWVIDNIDTIYSFIPRTYPRVVEADQSSYSGPLFMASVVLGLIAVGVVLLTSVMTYVKRGTRYIKIAQVEFLSLLLTGLLLLSGAAVLQALKPSNFRCVAVTWLVNVGYCLELVPLIVKVAAINRLMQAAKKMKRVKLPRDSLFEAVALLNFVVVLFVGLWTLLDPPSKETYYTLTTRQSSEGKTVIQSTNYCRSQSGAWNYASLAAFVFMLLCASVLAFQTRNLRKDLNESQSLAILIYSHFMFVSMRIAVSVLQYSLTVTVAAHMLSLLYSLDCIAACVIYFIPKFFGDSNDVGSGNTVLPSTEAGDTGENSDEPDRGNSRAFVTFSVDSNLEGTTVPTPGIHCKHCGKLSRRN